MRRCIAFLLLFLFITACTSTGGTARDPGRPAPVAGPAPEPATEEPPRVDPASEGVAGVPDQEVVPVRADQAPLVQIREALEIDSLLGRRVRVAGRCTGFGEGRKAGTWTLEGANAQIEVRGQVPTSCSAREGDDLIIFAQIEPKAPGSRDRLLLRLPD
jgi:hypothetical protein